MSRISMHRDHFPSEMKMVVADRIWCNGLGAQGDEVHVVDEVARIENIRREKGKTSSRKSTSDSTSDRRKKLAVFSGTSQ
jgi:hypothetical protein